MINGQLENIKPMNKQDRSKYKGKIVDLSEVFCIPRHIPDSQSINPPRCNKCKTISYSFSTLDTNDNICQECLNNDESIQEIKDDHQLEIDNLQASYDRLECVLEQLGKLKQEYFWKITTNQEKTDILDEIFFLID